MALSLKQKPGEGGTSLLVPSKINPLSKIYFFIRCCPSTYVYIRATYSKEVSSPNWQNSIYSNIAKESSAPILFVPLKLCQ